MTDEPEPFATPTFYGARFAKHRMPVDSLPDLVGYARLLKEVARTLYVKANNRLRLSHHHSQLLNFSIAAFEKGSVAVAICYAAPPGQHELFDYAEEARDLVAETVKAAGLGQPIPVNFPPQHLSLFDKFGRGLTDGEYIELRAANDQGGPRYTASIRDILLGMAKAEQEQELTVTGSVFEVNTETKSFQIHLSDRWAVKAEYAQTDHEQAVRSALGDTKKALVTVAGFARLTSKGRTTRMTRTTEITPHSDPGGPDIIERLKELRRLKTGWLDDRTPRIATLVIDHAGLVVQNAVALSGAPRPHLYPTDDGGIDAEWSFGPCEVSATFRKTGMLELHTTNTDTGVFEESEVEWDADDLAAVLRRYLRGAHT